MSLTDTIKGSNISQLILIVLFIIVVINLFYTSSNVGVSETQSYAAIISVIMIVVGVSLYKLTTSGKSDALSRGTVGLITIFIVGGLLFEFYKNYIQRSEIFDRASRDPTTRVFLNIIEITLIASIIIVGISFAQNTFGRYLNNSTDWFGFFMNLIVYIPCLLEDLIKYLKQQYNITSSVTFILLGIEATLIAMYVILPKLFNSKLLDDNIQILNDPVFLDIPVSKTFQTEDMGDKNRKRANYALSMWVYMNQQNISSENSNIFSYAGSYPKIEYIKSDTNSNKDKYKFTINDKSYDINIPNQKWNNIVINFNENKTVDIFVNGNLERTFQDTSRISLPNIKSNTINIGNSNGLYGAICNIKYYKIPLTTTQINQNYNLLYNKNPPVNKIM